jgi:hypothetical protein
MVRGLHVVKAEERRALGGEKDEGGAELFVFQIRNTSCGDKSNPFMRSDKNPTS